MHYEVDAVSTEQIIHRLKHYLPSQAPLKDFIHHNTLHAFQEEPFFDALRKGKVMFGYQTSFNLQQFRVLFSEGRINEIILRRIVTEEKGNLHAETWIHRMLYEHITDPSESRIGKLRQNWKLVYGVNLDSLVHPTLFRLLGSYLDQGISIWNFPAGNKGFLHALRKLESKSYVSIFKSRRVVKLLQDESLHMEQLLYMLVGNESYYEQYLFDQQMMHPGWSGMVSYLEDHPESLIDRKIISLHDLIMVELLLEIDRLDDRLGVHWAPLAFSLQEEPPALFEPVPQTMYDEVLMLWQKAYEWSYYDEVLGGIKLAVQNYPHNSPEKKSFQALLCIDDRECSFRRYLENADPGCETYGTPGFFGVEFYYQPEHGKHTTKLCPAPVTPQYLIREKGSKYSLKKDIHYNKHTHSFFGGWLISQTLGFWSALRLFLNIFRPSFAPATASSFLHMHRESSLTIDFSPEESALGGLQVGFKIQEMTDRVERVLRSIGLTHHFAPIIYVVGHGASSVNNTHYAGYDCGACSGRPGSVNARVFSYMANHPEVRSQLKLRGIDIPVETRFVGALHDTTRDEIEFYDVDKLEDASFVRHIKNDQVFRQALQQNAKERSRRFENISLQVSVQDAHDRIKRRSVSLFEPRPELNHATNALCVVGRRSLTDHLFLDRRAFMNSYDYSQDPDGKLLYSILKPAAPVCGGINLEYFFSRVDQYRLGAGTKLPHNVIGLYGVANGVEGDLRPGLPSQMIEVHDPVRLLFIVEQKPEIVASAIRMDKDTLNWFQCEWVNLVVVDPETLQMYQYKNDAFVLYEPISVPAELKEPILSLISRTRDNIPVTILKK